VDERFTELLQLADDGDRIALEIVSLAARRVARGILGVASILDLDTVVFGGPFWERSAATFLDVVPTAVSSDPALMLTHPIAFRGSRLGGDVAAIGAACLVLDRAFTPRPADILIVG
jgi:predicted NBD/HSP70 family sugar kinase